MSTKYGTVDLVHDITSLVREDEGEEVNIPVTVLVDGVEKSLLTIDLSCGKLILEIGESEDE